MFLVCCHPPLWEWGVMNPQTPKLFSSLPTLPHELSRCWLSKTLPVYPRLLECSASFQPLTLLHHIAGLRLNIIISGQKLKKYWFQHHFHFFKNVYGIPALSRGRLVNWAIVLDQIIFIFDARSLATLYSILHKLYQLTYYSLQKLFMCISENVIFKQNLIFCLINMFLISHYLSTIICLSFLNQWNIQT